MRRGVPDLVVEVLSPSTRTNDLGIKRERYMASGVRELWLVDPDARTVTRVRPDAAPDEVLGEGATLRSEALEGFALDVARIFPFPRESGWRRLLIARPAGRHGRTMPARAAR